MKHSSYLKTIPALVAIVAPVACIGFTAAPASASVVRSAAIRPSAVPVDSNYAGWLAGSFNRLAKQSADTTFTVPTITGCTTTDDFVVVGVGLPSATSIIATGVAVGCQGGAPFYGAETDINGTITPVPVNVQPGDKIILKLAVTGGATTGSFADATQGFTQPIKGKGGKSTGSCIGIDGSENGGSGDPPVPDFGKVAFSAGTINGETITASGAVRVNMGTSTGVLQISTGAVAKSGKGFTSTFVNTGN